MPCGTATWRRPLYRWMRIGMATVTPPSCARNIIASPGKSTVVSLMLFAPLPWGRPCVPPPAPHPAPGSRELLRAAFRRADPACAAARPDGRLAPTRQVDHRLLTPRLRRGPCQHIPWRRIEHL